MAILNEIAFFQNRRDEIPNQELAKKLASNRDETGIAEIAAHLFDKNASIASDCLKVLYEIAAIEPALAAPYVPDLLRLSKSHNNRLVWGAMIGLAHCAALNPDPCLAELSHLKQLAQQGSVITVDNAIKTLAALLLAQPSRREEVFPFLLEHLRRCRSKDVPQHAESIFPALSPADGEAFSQVLTSRLNELSPSQAKRVEKLIRNLGKK